MIFVLNIFGLTLAKSMKKNVLQNVTKKLIFLFFIRPIYGHFTFDPETDITGLIIYDNIWKIAILKTT